MDRTTPDDQTRRQVAAYVGYQAGDSAAASEAAWSGARLVPRVLRDVSTISAATTFLGHPVRAPIAVAPTAMHRLVTDDGETATARAASAAGCVYIVSMASTTSFEAIRAAVPDVALWQQLYVRSERQISRDVCQAAAAAGCRAIVLTVDAPVGRQRSVHGTSNLNQQLPLPILAPNDPNPDVMAIADDYAKDLTFDDLTSIREWTGLPLLVKGVLRADDAMRCIDSGADGVVVSSHGGRQVAGVIPTAYVLEEVVQAVGGAGEVYADGGLRSGADVLRALALGARGCLIGRPVLWGLAAGGSEAATTLLTDLIDDLERTMGLCGVASIDEIGCDLVRWHRELTGGVDFVTQEFDS